MAADGDVELAPAQDVGERIHTGFGRSPQLLLFGQFLDRIPGDQVHRARQVAQCLGHGGRILRSIIAAFQQHDSGVAELLMLTPPGPGAGPEGAAAGHKRKQIKGGHGDLEGLNGEGRRARKQDCFSLSLAQGPNKY